MYKAAIFDLDGTLLDTGLDLRICVNHVLEKHGYPLQSEEEIRIHVGKGVRRFIYDSIPGGGDDPNAPAIFDDFVAYYAEHCMDNTGPFPGTKDMLYALRDAGVKLAVSSNKTEPEVVTLMEHHFPGVFTAMAGNVEGRPTKPDPDAVFRILDKFGLEKKDAVYVGDSDTDVLTAKNAGLDCISVTWGFRTAEELTAAGATRFADTAEQLYGMILGG